MEDDLDVNSFPTEGLVNWAFLQELNFRVSHSGKDTRAKLLILLPSIFRKAVNLKTLTYDGKVNHFTKGIKLVTDDASQKALCKLETLGSPEDTMNFYKSTKEHHTAVLKLNVRLKKVYLKFSGEFVLQLLDRFKETCCG
ncbi:hypothetical protein Fcan01_22705 [Folsomia candida]|uniref:Uncharacterized protein n=1 Tax=Folsomia candida TaxID=158441 RepID=A0A226DC92_FOLCA|nr:hypothetical protein Fcan01_22705 [Folsomia candida]